MKGINRTYGIGGWIQRNSWPLMIIAGLLGLWELYSRFFNPRGDVYFPSIGYVIEQSIEYQDMLIEAIQQTVMGVLLGYPLGMAMGIVLGLIVAESFTLRQGTLPIIVFIHALPVAILAPLFIIWFGTGLTAVALFVGLASFYQLFINTITGFSTFDREYIYLADALDATRWQTISKIKFWIAFPHIIAGMKIGVQQAVVGVIVIEFIASGQGLGNLIILSVDTLRNGLLFGSLIIIMIFAMVLYNLVEFLLNRMFPQLS